MIQLGMRMRTDTDCGPVLVSNLLQLTYEETVVAWHWPNSGGWWDNLRDSQGAHFRMFARNKVPWRIVTLQDIIQNRCRPGKVGVLLHTDESDITIQHWAQYIGHVTLQNGTPGVCLDFGGVKSKDKVYNDVYYTMEYLTLLYTRGAPNCAYEIGIGSIENNPVERFWDWTMERLQRVFYGRK